MVFKILELGIPFFIRKKLEIPFKSIKKDEKC
jgi:hypothetical protein